MNFNFSGFKTNKNETLFLFETFSNDQESPIMTQESPIIAWFIKFLCKVPTSAYGIYKIEGL